MDNNLMHIFDGSTETKTATQVEDGDDMRGNGNPLQYPCLGNPMERGVWRGLKKSDMTQRLNNDQQGDTGHPVS